MIEFSFLAYIPDPFVVQQSCYMLLEPGGKVRTISAREVSSYREPLLTYDVPTLVDDLQRMKQAPPKNLLDIGDALRLVVALPKDDGGERLWDIWSALKRFFDSSTDCTALELIVESKKQRPEPVEQRRLLKEAVKALRLQWESLALKLKSVGEFERLISVEWPLHGIFAYRQFNGVRVDAAGAHDLLSRVSSEKYAAYREVAKFLKMSPTDLTFWNIHPYLDRTDVSHLATRAPGGRLQDAFELAASHSEFASCFLSLVKSKRDEAIIKRVIGGHERVYPIFHIFGTISGRILVSDPYLQQLQRAYRSLIAPDTNSRLVYLDYAQFEPGVLAGLSEDKHLTEAYNGGDVYTALAKALFQNPNGRPMAKRVFLAYSYGMTTDHIAALLGGSEGSHTEQKAYAKRIHIFFEQFSKLEDYRITQQKKLFEEGMVSSLLGNRRLRTRDGTLTFKEKRWALNHPVQSTASLIFKEALLSIAKEIGAEKIILPIHDAVLLQLDNGDNFEREVKIATDMMIAAFGRRLPRIKARVKVGSFAE